MTRMFPVLFLLLSLPFTVNAQRQNITDFVDPFIGTEEMGHTFPGAAAPFGLVQLSPETDTLLYSYGRGYNPGVYRYCAGYQYDDSTITGFSHTHFNGTGHSDLGDFLIMPMVGRLHLNPGTANHPETGYRSRFSHEREKASPGYYAVHLDDYNIEAELTATERAGLHRYTFPASDSAHVILDCTSGIYNYEGKVVWSWLRMENDTLVTGYRQTEGWARDRRLYFAMAFSKAPLRYGFVDKDKPLYRGFWRKFAQDDNFPERAGKELVAHFDFVTGAGEAVLVKFALSAVSSANAVENLEKEIPDWDFDRVRRETGEKWSRELGRVLIEADDRTMINFYTALYHAFLSPVVYSDVNGQYRGLDQNIRKTDGWTDYTIFSLWDTYRALHPLFTILQQQRTNDMIQSMLAHYQESVHHILPVWSHYNNENWCMIGYHAVPVIADAYLKGIRDYDVDLAFQAVVASSNYDPYDGIGAYRRYGYVPEDLSGNSASKTLEYAYDDWTIARFAEELGRKDIAKKYLKRAANYRNIFDPATGFLRARLSDGGFKSNFDPMSTHGQGYIEGNAWNYSLYVPQDVAGFVRLIGGEDKLEAWLDSLFVMSVADESIAANEDITREGMIGNYVHGNEPSHHVAYLYNYIGRAYKTQTRVRQIMDTMYRPEPDGLCGNDDCGQMSAWYIFSALGFYPVCPGSNQYVIGSPAVEQANINLENDRVFRVRTDNFSEKNVYLQQVFLNGKSLKRNWISHTEIMNGGELRFILGDTPNKTWAGGNDERPLSMSRR